MIQFTLFAVLSVTLEHSVTLEAAFDEARARYEELIKAHDEAYALYLKSLSTPSEVTYPTPVFAPRFFEIFDQYPDRTAGVDAAVWVLKANIRDQALKDRILTRFIDDHADDPRMIGVMDHASTIRTSPLGTDFLEAVAAENESPGAKGMAYFYLGFTYLGKWDASILAKADEKVREILEQTPHRADLDIDSDVFWERAVESFEKVLGNDEYRALHSESLGKPLGEFAERSLYRLRNLKIGMPAPEIEGEDIHGVPFKLSDYRGRVVMLDFWGDW